MLKIYDLNWQEAEWVYGYFPLFRNSWNTAYLYDWMRIKKSRLWNESRRVVGCPLSPDPYIPILTQEAGEKTLTVEKSPLRRKKFQSRTQSSSDQVSPLLTGSFWDSKVACSRYLTKWSQSTPPQDPGQMQRGIVEPVPRSSQWRDSRTFLTSPWQSRQLKRKRTVESTKNIMPGKEIYRKINYAKGFFFQKNVVDVLTMLFSWLGRTQQPTQP